MSSTASVHPGLLSLIASPATREQGFRLLMQRYGKAIYWHIRRIVVGREDAEDVLQDSCIKVLDSLASFRGDEASLIPWIYRIATRESLMQLRRKTHLLQSIDSLGDTLTRTLEAESGAEGGEELLLQKALLSLTTTQRIVFNMRYFDDMSYEQMAQVTGKSVGTLKTHYHYAVERVKNYLKENAT